MGLHYIRKPERRVTASSRSAALELCVRVLPEGGLATALASALAALPGVSLRPECAGVTLVIEQAQGSRPPPSGPNVALLLAPRPASLSSAWQDGVRVLIANPEPFSVILEGLHAAQEGRCFLSPGVQLVMAAMALTPPGRELAASDPLDRLSPRELEVVFELPAGGTHRQIAARMHLSVATLRTHLQHIRQKTGLRRDELALRLRLRSELYCSPIGSATRSSHVMKSGAEESSPVMKAAVGHSANGRPIAQ